MHCLSLLWFSAGLITATVRCLVNQSTTSVDFSYSRTQRHDSYSSSVVLITSLMLSSFFTGCECRKGSYSGSPCRLIGQWWHGESLRAPPTSLLSSQHRLRSSVTDWVCSFLLSDFLPSVDALCLSLVLVYGTIYHWRYLLTVAVHI